MSEGSSFPLPGLGRRRPIHSGNFYLSLLEMIPHAALIIDNQEQQVIFANSKSAELSAYTRAELSGMALTSLFENWDNDSMLAIETAASPEEKTINATLIPLIKRNRQRINVTATSIALEADPQRALIVLQIYPERRAEQRSDAKFWESMQLLLSAQWEERFEEALELALHAGLRLTGAESAAFFQVSEQRLELCLRTTAGTEIDFPEILPIHDLVQLSRPNIWIAGKRSTSALHRTARAALQNYLLSAAIGQSNALIGLVAFAGVCEAPGERALALTDLVAKAIHTILVHHNEIDQLTSIIHAQRRHNTINLLLREHMNEGFLLVTPRLNIIELNQPAEIMLGYNSSEVTGQPIEKVLIADQPLSPVLSAAQQASPTYHLGNVRLYRRSGEAFLTQVRVFPLVYSDQVEGIIVFFQDLSDQEQIRRQAHH